ncbi:hypothetical protein [Calidifontibacter indicus]|uniref:hypothetical protein n=1 Tax=Calidifontibacter indicus TaxID=419650 RepID=UPI003D7182E3
MGSTNPKTGKPTGAFVPAANQQWAYITLAFGSAMALFMYPHSITAVLSSKSRTTIRRNASILPAYSFLLALLALLGWIAIAADTKPLGLDGKANAQLVVPQLVEDPFPSWFAGVAFAAFVLNVLVSVVLTAVLRAATVPAGRDETVTMDYFADEDDPRGQAYDPDPFEDHTGDGTGPSGRHAAHRPEPA